MKSGKAGKMATALTVFLLMLSGFAVVQWNAQSVEASEQDEYASRLWGIINPDGDIDSDLDIMLKSLSTGEMVEETQTDENYYEFEDVRPGWYEVMLPSQVMEGTAYMGESVGPIELIGENVRADFEGDDTVDMEEIDHTLEVEVLFRGDPVEDVDEVTLTLEDRDRGFSYDGFEVISEENATFEGDIYSDFDANFMVEKDGYAPYFEPSLELDVENETTVKEVELSRAPAIQGYLEDEDGDEIDGTIDITFYNEEVGVLHRRREGPYFKVRVPAGDHTLAISAQGYRPEMLDVSLGEDDTKMFELDGVEKSEPEEFSTDIDLNYGDDLNELEVKTSRQIRASTRMESLDYASVGNLPMQIALTLGQQDLEVTEDDVEEFKRRLTYTDDIAYTSRFISVNDTVYELEDYEPSFSEDFEEALIGDVTEDLFEETLYYTSTSTYTSVEDIDTADHVVNLTVQNDHRYGNERDFTYNLNLIDGYERFVEEEESAQRIPENVEVDGYTDIEINPGENGRTSDIIFDVRESEEGEVDIILDREPWIYEPEDTENYTDYVIRKDTEAEIRARYDNPISRAVNYTWWFADEEPIEYGEEAFEFTHAFNETGEKLLNVEVEESSGRLVSDNITIMVDNEGPQGENITVDGEDIELGAIATVDEDTEVYFNASAFEDEATGMISNYEWNFTDTNETRSGGNMTNVSHTFTVPGTYDVILNVTDAVGNWNEVNISVKVNDITAPTVIIKAEWDDETSEDDGIEITKDTSVTFNGTESYAHPDYEGDLTDFDWEIEELGKDGTGTHFEHDFDEVGEYTVILNVTDEAGNTAEGIMEVNVVRGPTPNLRLTDLTFSTRDIRVGDDVTISVNITNDGDANASALQPVLEVDGEEVDISPEYYQDGEPLNETDIGPGETVTMEIEWSPESDGELTITVNVTDAEEPTDLYWNNELEDTVTVDPPVWREYIVYALIPIIIIGVTVGLYFYKDKLKELLSR